MNELQITRADGVHLLKDELTPEGEFYFGGVPPLRLGGLTTVMEVERMEQVFTNGWLSAVHTHYVLYALDNEGRKIDPTGQNPRYCRRLSMTANSRDRKDFARGYAPTLKFPMWNGYFRSALGYNYTPPFNSQTGQLISYTAEQEAAAPTGDYGTYHSDGTPINADTDSPAV